MIDEPRTYRALPVEIQAFRWDGSEKVAHEIEKWSGDLVYLSLHKLHLVVGRRDGESCAQPGEYIVKDISGDFYPCKPEIFAEKYALVHWELAREGDS